MLVGGALGGDGGFPRIMVAPRRLVIVAQEQPGFGRKVEQPPDRAEELVRAAAREIGPRGAEVGHEQGVADERRVADPVGDIGRGVAGDVEHLDGHLADLDAVAVGQQPVEIAMAGHGKFDAEHRSERGLDVAHSLADRDFGAGARLDQGAPLK